MSYEVQQIIATLDSIKSVDEGDDLQKLDESVTQLFASDSPQAGIDALLRIFERFPANDGVGIFWRILHGLEELGGYEEKLVASVKRQPSYSGLNMLNRLLNAGYKQIDETDVLSLMKTVAANPSLASVIRTSAQGLVDWQESR